MIIKCKMCGGDLHPVDQSSICECEFCGTRQTVPALDNEKKANLFNRANRLRMSAEFDKAALVYESIVAEFQEEAEAYWGLCLCSYGIEYVDDPSTGEKKPTCHRTLPVSIMEDPNFEQACDYADAIARRVYRDEAKAIDRIQKDILDIVSTEKPYDVFICYKETADDGGRTEDSVLGQEIYDALTSKGLKVFFSRISLEDKLGQQYEPYIYAALSSAKVMIAMGTRYEYYDAVWVKNEWMRFLSMMKSDRTKTLIPCFKDLDAYDMPKEFKQLQAQDMGKLGWLQDLTRGVLKLCGKTETATSEAQFAATVPQGPTVGSLLKRASMFIDEHNWEKAISYCDQALDMDPESGEAYWLKELANRQCENADALAAFYRSNPYEHESQMLTYVRRFASPETKEPLACFDEGMREFKTQKAKEKEEKKQQDSSDPLAEKKRQLIMEAVRTSSLMEGKIYESLRDATFVITEDGSAQISPSQHYYSRTIANQVTSWKGVERFYPIHGCCVGLKTDGSILVATASKESGLKDIPNWKGIKELYFTQIGYYGLTRDGSVLFEKNPDCKHDLQGADQVSDFQDIYKLVYLYAYGRLIGIKKDGTLTATPYTGNIAGEKIDQGWWDEASGWTDIRDLIGIPGRVVGIKKDGTLVATKGTIVSSSHFKDVWEEMCEWKHIIKIVNWLDRYIGVDEYGELCATSGFERNEDDGDYDHNWNMLFSWHELIDFFIKDSLAYGLKMDGTLLISETFGRKGELGKLQIPSGKWKDIIKVHADRKCFICIRRDGTVWKHSFESNQFTQVFREGNNFQPIRVFTDFEKYKTTLVQQSKKSAYDTYVTQREKLIQEHIDRIQATSDVERLDREMSTIITERDQKLKEISEKRDSLMNEKRALDHKRAGLGIFKGKEKAALSDQIEDIQKMIEALPTEKSVRDSYQPQIDSINQKKQEVKEQAYREAREAYPILPIDAFEEEM